MSLLLDALKKNGQTATGLSTSNQSALDKLSEMTLENLPSKPSSPQSSTTTSNATPRGTGENLFAAKKAPVRKKFQYNLGIVPTAMIIGLALGTAGGIYLWMELQPPNATQYRSPSPSIAANTTSAPRPAPPLALPPEFIPVANAHASMSPPAPLTENHARTGIVKRVPNSPSSQGSQITRVSQRTPNIQTPASQKQAIQIQRKTENDDLYATLMSAYQAYQNGDLATAWQRYREVLIRDAKNRDALLGMAAIAQQQEQDEVAIQYYQQVLALDPRDPLAHAGMSSFSTSDPSVRESRLKLSLAQTPQSAALHFALGNIYTEQSRWGDAQQAYFNAFKIEPSNAQFAFNLAASLDHLGQHRIAAQYYRQALQLDTQGNAGFERVKIEHRLKQLLSIF